MAARKTNIYTCRCCRTGAKVHFTGLFTFHILPHVQSTVESVVKCFVNVFNFYKHSNSTNMIISV